MKTASAVPCSSCLITELASFFDFTEISLTSDKNFGGEVFPITTSPEINLASG